jgi:hypothetical protein
MEEEKENRSQLRELADEEEQIISEYCDRYKSHEYQNTFYPPPSGDWKVDAPFVESYFESAKLILTSIYSGALPEGVAGPSACFLCRHYLELALKYTLFHSRWLKDEQHNAPDDEVESVGKKEGHLLLRLWSKLDAEVKSRMPSILASGLDLAYVEEFVKDFDGIDPNGERFRYSGPELAVKPKRPPVPPPALGIDFSHLLFSLELVHDVLTTVDTYLVEQYGQNQEWEEELNSW